jgi:hypothetical protein
MYDACRDMLMKIDSCCSDVRGRVSCRAVPVKMDSAWRAVLPYAVVLEASVRTVNCRLAFLDVDSVRSALAIIDIGVEDALW